MDNKMVYEIIYKPTKDAILCLQQSIYKKIKNLQY